MNEFKVVIAGSREFCHYVKLKEVVDRLLENKARDHRIEVVSGAAQGPDTLGRAYALERGYRVSVLPAKWDEEGKSAGMKRNERMAQYADAAIVFWNGASVGSKHMIKTMLNMGKPVRIVMVDTVNQEIMPHKSAKEMEDFLNE